MRRFIRQLQVPALILAAMMLVCLPSVQAADNIQVPPNLADDIITAHNNADSQAQNEAIQAMVNWLNENTDWFDEQKQTFLKNWLIENLDMPAEEAEELAFLYFPVIDLEEEREELIDPERPLTQDDQDPSPGIN